MPLLLLPVVVLLALLLLPLLGAATTFEPSPAPEPTPAPAPTAAPTPETSSASPETELGQNLRLFLGLDSILQQRPSDIPPGTDASVPDEPPDLPGGAYGYSHYVFEKLGDQVATTLVEGPRDGQVRIPVSYSQLREVRDSGGATEHLEMSREELDTLVDQLDTIRASTEKYRDVRVAEAEGFIRTTDEVPNMGAHFINPWLTVDGIFDPARPEVLIYVRDEQGEWELVGTSFVQLMPVASPDHPEAFAGPLDNWHVHYELCTGPRIAILAGTPEECEAAGGVWVPSYGWMIHAWVWVDNPLGVFSMWNPNIPPIVTPDYVREMRSAEAAQTVSIENFSFRAARLRAGETLAWTNVDAVPHTVTAERWPPDAAGVDSDLIGPGQSFEVTLDEPGEYTYTCSLHSFMSGTIVVTR